jgi:hypothetical protein
MRPSIHAAPAALIRASLPPDLPADRGERWDPSDFTAQPLPYPRVQWFRRLAAAERRRGSAGSSPLKQRRRKDDASSLCGGGGGAGVRLWQDGPHS